MEKREKKRKRVERERVQRRGVKQYPYSSCPERGWAETIVLSDHKIQQGFTFSEALSHYTTETRNLKHLVLVGDNAQFQHPALVQSWMDAYPYS